MDALREGDCARMPLDPEATHIENREEIPFGEGVRGQASAADFRRSLLDAGRCETFSEVIGASGSRPHAGRHAPIGAPHGA